jgi:hypothetical protein
MRAALAVVIVLNLAVLAVMQEARATRMRAACARVREAAKAVSLENRTLLLAVARARRPDEVEKRAARHGVEAAGERR